MRALLELVAPPLCVTCGQPTDGELCGRCADGVVVLAEPLCPRCGGPAVLEPCACTTLLGFVHARSLVAFAEPARALTLALKRRGLRSTAFAMGRLLGELASARGLYTGTEVVTFVPGGRAVRRRGFDHGELLARAVGAALGARVSCLLGRATDGPRQADVPFSERRSNVHDRFAARDVRDRVLLIDDVFTTGATAEACSIALVRAGAPSVNVVTWARTLRRRP